MIWIWLRISLRRLLSNYGALKGNSYRQKKVKGFLYTTARNLALNHIKHNQIVDEHLRLQEKDSVLFFRNQIIEEETYQLVHKAVEQLPKQSCKIIQLSLQGYSNQEIADQLNISINSVRTRETKMLIKKLRGILKEHFYLLPLMLKMNFFLTSIRLFFTFQSLLYLKNVRILFARNAQKE